MIWTAPAAEATGVPLLEPIRVHFDRFLAPYAALRQSICLQSASVGRSDANLTRCLNSFLEPSYDPVDRVAVFRPSAPLLPNTRYNVVLLAPKAGSDLGVRAFDGGALEEDYLFAFWTGSGSESPTRIRGTLGFYETLPGCGSRPPDDGGSARTLLDASPLSILGSCSSPGNCHAADARDAGWPYGSALRLRTPEGDPAAAVRRLVEDEQVATETATAPRPGAAQRSAGAVFAQNMPYLDPTSPGNSYLLYKMLIGLSDAYRPPLAPRQAGCGSSETGDAMVDALDAGVPQTPAEPWLPDDAFRPAAPGEYERLREAIRGEPMPYGTSAPWSWSSTISAWISSGAGGT